jgi:hypothetical protein
MLISGPSDEFAEHPVEGSRSEGVAIRFFRLILPESGHYAAVRKRKNADGFMSNVFASSIEELAEAIENYDRDGYETYHACASFKEAVNDPPGTPAGQKRHGRTKRNAWGAKSFWLDPDVGPKKPYATITDAVRAVAEFCHKLNLPPPIRVFSGSGLHVYWPLRETLERQAWERYAKGLKVLCERHGLHADPARTADISSVLRTPGTLNRKRQPVQRVECDPASLDIEPYEIERFQVFLDAVPKAEGSKENGLAVLSALDPAPIEVLRKMPDRGVSENLVSGVEEEYPPAYGTEIVKHCGQLREFQEKRGDIPEPTWNNNLGVLAHCEDGDALAHEISKGDPRYNFEETQGKLDRWRNFGPTTCVKFHGDNPKPCLACPHWEKITSPIVLGHRPELGVGAAAEGVTTLRDLHWELTEKGAYRAKSYANTVLGLRKLSEEYGIKFRYDVFHERRIIELDGFSTAAAGRPGRLSQNTRDALRFAPRRPGQG